MASGEQYSGSSESETEMAATAEEEQVKNVDVVTSSSLEDDQSCSESFDQRAATSEAVSMEDGIDRLLVRHRNEILGELRRLQLAERPVTGDTVRHQSVSDLVSRFIRPAGGDTSSQLDRRPDVTVSRPEEVLVEVNALVERRPVTSVLRSVAFRNSIENSLRGAVRSLQRDHRAASLHFDQLHQQQIARTRIQLNNNNDDSQHSASSNVDLELRSSAGETGSVAEDVPLPPDLPTQPAGSERAEAWLRQLPNNQPEEQQQMTALEVLEEMHHENFIMEISELIQQQLVTSTLQGPIRNVLERQMTDRLERSGADGQRVLQHIRRLQPSTLHRRNDFFDLGIPTGGQAAADDISVISATAAVAVPQSYAQNTAAVGREINSLKTQMLELKNMLQLSFDLQLDIQRAIRQEVSAAVSQAMAGRGAELEASGGAVGGRPVADSGNCLICLDQPVDTVLYQCGHMCLCHTCGMRLRQRGAHCPVCRAPIRDIIRAYRSA